MGRCGVLWRAWLHVALPEAADVLHDNQLASGAKEREVGWWVIVAVANRVDTLTLSPELAGFLRQGAQARLILFDFAGLDEPGCRSVVGRAQPVLNDYGPRAPPLDRLH